MKNENLNPLDKSDEQLIIEALQNGKLYFCPTCKNITPTFTDRLDNSNKEPDFFLCLLCKVGRVEV